MTEPDPHPQGEPAGRAGVPPGRLRPRRAGAPGWGLAHAAVGFFAGLAGASLASGVWVAASGTTRVTLGSLIAGLLGLWAGYLATCLFVARTRGTGRMSRDFGLRLGGIHDLWIGSAAGLASSLLLVRAVYFVLVLAGVVSEDDLERLADPAERLTRLVDGGGVLVLVLLVGLGAPIVEELFFRGLMQRALVSRLGGPAGVGVGAVVFGAAHLQPLQFPALAAFGIVLGALAHRTGRLGPGIVAHVVFNGLTLVSLFVLR